MQVKRAQANPCTVLKYQKGNAFNMHKKEPIVFREDTPGLSILLNHFWRKAEETEKAEYKWMLLLEEGFRDVGMLICFKNNTSKRIAASLRLNRFLSVWAFINYNVLLQTHTVYKKGKPWQRSLRYQDWDLVRSDRHVQFCRSKWFSSWYCVKWLSKCF